jgi:hypothetical protein
MAVLLLGTSLSPAQQPLRPTLSVKALELAVLVSWDSVAEKSTTANPFSGYRLYRARLKEGPYALLREWQKIYLVSPEHSFLDIGDDNADKSLTGDEGLRNELTYYYRLCAYADSVVSPYRPYSETFSDTLLAIPRAASTSFEPNPVTLRATTGWKGSFGTPSIVVTNKGNFRTLLEGHDIRIDLTTQGAGTDYVFPVVITDVQGGFKTVDAIVPGCQTGGDSVNPGPRSGTFVSQNAFGFNAFDVQIPWSFQQRATPLKLDSVYANAPSGANTPVFWVKDSSISLVGMFGTTNTLGESSYQVDFLPGGIDTVNLTSKRIYKYLNVRVTESSSARELLPDTLNDLYGKPRMNHWTVSRFAYNLGSSPNVGIQTRSANRYYLSSRVDSSANWEFTNVIAIENVRIVADFANKGSYTAGRRWPAAPVKGTVDFAAGDRLLINVRGGAFGPLPFEGSFTYDVGEAAASTPTASELEAIRVVPNPYLIRHEAQRSAQAPSLRFDYLPEQCEIRIYTVALDLVRVLYHQGGPTEFWDLTNKAGNRVGSQLFLAHIEAPGGASMIKKFAVVVGE